MPDGLQPLNDEIGVSDRVREDAVRQPGASAQKCGYSSVMRCTYRNLLGILASMALAATASAQYQVVWEDNFDGNTLDLTKWTPMIGTGCPNVCGWGNNELQYYRAENATVANGMLTITARRENFGGQQYTSARCGTPLPPSNPIEYSMILC